MRATVAGVRFSREFTAFGRVAACRG